jgi:hypothetical protein
VEVGVVMRWQLARALLAGGLLPAALLTAGLASAATAQAAPPGGILSVVAGGPGGPDPAVNVSVVPCGVKFARGQLYVGGLAVVYRVSQATGRLVPVAGSGPWGTSAGSTGDGVPAAGAELAACGITADTTGNLLLANGTSVRVVAAKTGTYYGQQMTGGRVYTLARGFNDAVDVELDPFGNLVVADHGTAGSETNPELDAQIWVVAESTGTYYGQKMTRGHAYLIAGGGSRLSGPAIGAEVGIADQLAVGGSGNLLLSDNKSGRILSISR